jgi:hypothetical protein
MMPEKICSSNTRSILQIMKAITNMNTLKPLNVTDASTCELIAVADMADTLENVLTGLSQAPRCSGAAEDWARALIEYLHGIQEITCGALCQRDDENQMRAATLARQLEWAYESDHESALLIVLGDVAARAAKFRSEPVELA